MSDLTPAQIRDCFAEYRDAWRPIRDEAAADMQAISPGGPWSQEDRDARKGSGRPCIHLDQLNQFLAQVHGNVRKSKRSVKAIPKGNGANDEDAEKRSALIMAIEDTSQAQPIYLGTFESMTQRSYGFAAIRTECKDCDIPDEGDISPSVFDQQIVIKPISNPDMVLISPAYKQPNASDITDGFLLDLITKKQFKEKYKGARVTDFSEEDLTDKGMSDWIKDKYVQVAEFWKINYTSKKLLLIGLPDGTSSVFREEDWKQAKAKGAQGQMKRERVIEIPNVVQYMTNGFEILDETPWAGTRIPIISCLGPERWTTEGGTAERQLLSMVRFARDPQMMLDYLASGEAETAGKLPKIPFVLAKGQAESDKEVWEEINKVPHAFVQYDLVLDAGGINAAPPPQFNNFSPEFETWEVAIDARTRSIQAAMGISPMPDAAQRRNQKSGVALEKMDDMESMGSFHFIDRYENGFLYNMGWQINELIEPILDTQREMPTSTPDGKRATMQIVGNTSHPLTGDGSYDVQGGDGQPLADDHLHTGKGDFDVTISTGPSYQSEREEQDEFVDQLIDNVADLPAPGSPQGKVLALGIRMRPTLGPIGRQIADIFDPPDPSNLPPAAQAIITQLQGQLQQAQQESSALHMERAGKVLEQQTKLLMQQMKEDGANQREQLANDIKVLVAEIGAKSQDAQQRAQLYQEFVQLNHVQAHEAAIQAVEHQHAATQATQAQQAAALQQQQATPTPQSPNPGQ